jgi:lysophospholipase L1-like esterase
MKPPNSLVRSAVLVLALGLPSGAVSVSQATDPADRAVPRNDPNSQTAHAELVDKARRGRIDIYFVGDSITRRWGALDYPELLANWRKNFHGWNAANFGWGADTTQNILWRLQESWTVNPRSSTGGHQQVGTEPGGDAKVENIVRGIKAILDVCRVKAPNATLVLTGLFPRNDNPATWPEILRINARIARFADGAKIRYVDVNHKLAGRDGTLYDGMTVDKLHPTIAGTRYG